MKTGRASKVVSHPVRWWQSSGLIPGLMTLLVKFSDQQVKQPWLTWAWENWNITGKILLSWWNIYSLNQLRRQGPFPKTSPVLSVIWPEILLSSIRSWSLQEPQESHLRTVGDEDGGHRKPQHLALFLLSDWHSQNHFTAEAKDQKFYGRLGNYSSPSHLPFHLHTHCPGIANSSSLLSCFSKDFTAGKQRLEIFQKLGHSCLQEPIWKPSCRKSPSFFKAPATGFAQLRRLQHHRQPSGLLPTWVCPRRRCSPSA